VNFCLQELNAGYSTCVADQRICNNLACRVELSCLSQALLTPQKYSNNGWLFAGSSTKRRKKIKRMHMAVP